MLTVNDLMSTNLCTVHPETSLAFALERMNHTECRQLPVLEDGRLVGILSERDIRLAIETPVLDMDYTHHQEELNRYTVGEFMTANPKTVSPEIPAGEAADLLRTMKIGALPVMRNGELVGIITVSDFLRYIGNQLRPIPNEVKGHM